MPHIEHNPQNMTLGHLLAKVSRLVGNRMRMRLEGTGLPHAQGMILFHLGREDGLAQNVLAQALHITPPTATNTLQRMERDGWIVRRRDPDDQRIVRVYLTEKALPLSKESRTLFMELDRELTTVLGDDERNTLMQTLTKVHGKLSQTMEVVGQSCPVQEKPGDAAKEQP